MTAGLSCIFLANRTGPHHAEKRNTNIIMGYEPKHYLHIHLDPLETGIFRDEFERCIGDVAFLLADLYKLCIAC